MRSIISFVCQECGYDSPQWLGKCPECGEWNTLKELKAQSSKFKSLTYERKLDALPKTLNEISYEEKDRLKTGFSEVDGVLGGGIVRGSVTLLAGDPGIGKSTLLLQIALEISSRLSRVADDAHLDLSKNQMNSHLLSKRLSSSLKNLPKKDATAFSSSASGQAPCSLYISGEESEEQIKLRAKRLERNFQNGNFLLLSINDTNAVLEIIEKIKPSFVVIDSIQTMESEDLTGLSGSVGQVRYAASLFIKTAKTLGIPIVMVGHVTKEGMVAGPMVLSHMVDTLLFFEGEKFTQTRILRCLKNRFGPIDEVGVFTMTELGIREIKDPQHLFLTERSKNIPGSVIVVALEGTRAIPVEIQALVVFSKLPLPRRVSSGIDPKRLELLLAVLQKHCGVPLGTMDVFVNVVGGLKLADPSADLAVCVSLFSSFKNISLGKTVCLAEVGLLGELRNVVSLEKRIKEAQKLGFKDIISVKTHKTLNEVIKLVSRKYQ